MPLLRKLTDESGNHISYIFWCPGCKTNHSYCVQRKDPKDVGPVWNWNGSLDKPTFTPSLLVWMSRAEQRCHIFLTDGKIQFLGDCAHDLKNQTVPLIDYDTLESQTD